MLDTMVASKTNPDENYLEAIFEFGCKSRGSDRQSYPTVVAGGLNATKLRLIYTSKSLHGKGPHGRSEWDPKV